MKNFSNENLETIYTINGEEDAYNCGLFNHIYAANRKRNFNYTGINISRDGTIYIDCFWTNVTSYEKEDFINKPIRFYKKNLPNRTVAISIRGALSMDCIIDPTIYNDNRIELIDQKKGGIAFLVDTNDNRIHGIRAFILEDQVCETLKEATKKMLRDGVTKEDIFFGFRYYIMPNSPSKFLKQAVCVGRERESCKIQDLYVLDALLSNSSNGYKKTEEN